MPAISIEAFLDSVDSAASLLIFTPHHISEYMATDLPIATPYLLGHTKPTVCSAYPPVSLHLSNDYSQYRNFNLLSIAYDLRPRLRPRLTLSGRAFLRKPWAFDGRDSHSPCATYASILSCVMSTIPFGIASTLTQCSSTD